MKAITIFMKDGNKHEFVEKGRAGGSYTISLRYEGSFVIVKDEWGDETAFPANDVLKVEAEQWKRW